MAASDHYSSAELDFALPLDSSTDSYLLVNICSLHFLANVVIIVHRAVRRDAATHCCLSANLGICIAMQIGDRYAVTK